MQKNAKVKLYSEEIMKLINEFDCIKKGKNKIVNRMSILSKILKINTETTDYVLNTTCGAKDFHELADIIEDFERVSDLASFHIERVTKLLYSDEEGRSYPCVKDIVNEEIRSLAAGNKFVKKYFSDKIEKCSRTHPPRSKS